MSRGCRVEGCPRDRETPPTRFEDGTRLEMCPQHVGEVQRIVRETRKTPGEAARLVRQGRRVAEVTP